MFPLTTPTDLKSGGLLIFKFRKISIFINKKISKLFLIPFPIVIYEQNYYSYLYCQESKECQVILFPFNVSLNPSFRGADDQTDHLKTKLVRLDSDRRELFMTGEETKKRNNDIIDQLKRENKELKRLRDENLQNKRVYYFESSLYSTIPSIRL